MIFIILIFLISKSVYANLIFSFIPLSIFSIGQEYQFLAVSKNIIVSSQYPDGRMLSFLFSPFVVLSYAMIISSFFLFIFGKLRVEKMVVLSWLLVPLIIILSSIKSPFFSTYSLLFSLNRFGLAIFLLIFFNYLKQMSKKESQEFWKIIFFQLAFSLIFISLISIAQLLKGSPLGLAIESTKVAPIFGVGADESELIFRPMGLFTHANIMANKVFIFTISLFLIFSKFSKDLKVKIFNFFIITSLASIFTIIIAQSRSIYLSLLFFLLSLGYLFKTRVFNYFKKLGEFFNKRKTFWLIVFLFSVLVVGNRFIYSFYSFSETGGAEVRRELNHEALFLINKYPFWGVGNGMFVPALASENPSGIISTFAESVHNGFLLFFVENGFFAQVAVIFATYFLFREITFSNKNKPIKLILIIGLISQLIPMFFQPFINYFSVYTILAIGYVFDKNN